jgi:NTP pyrophosphatase (non-canonical NTP hydrolase)
MSKKKFDLNDWQTRLTQFARDRDWEQFHTPKNLAMALSVEASELVEIFQWIKDNEEAQNTYQTWKGPAADELADILVYILRFASVTDIDLNTAIEEKMKKNALKYPVEKVKGSSKKYSEYK